MLKFKVIIGLHTQLNFQIRMIEFRNISVRNAPSSDYAEILKCEWESNWILIIIVSKRYTHEEYNNS